MNLENQFIGLKKRVLSGQKIDCSTDFDNIVFVSMNNKSNNNEFLIELNRKIITTDKTWTSIVKQLLILIDKNFNYSLNK